MSTPSATITITTIGTQYPLSANSELEYYTSATRTPGFSPFTLQSGGTGPGS
jgi:hypothetical protein